MDPRGIVLDFCSTFWILSEVTSRKNLWQNSLLWQGEFRLWRIFLLAAHVSELPSPCSQNANPYSCRRLHEGARLRRAHQKNKGRRVQLSGVDPRGIVLDFCSTFWILPKVHLAKIFGHRSQNNSLGCFAHCVQFPFLKGSTKRIRDGECGSRGWTLGESFLIFARCFGFYLR